MKILKMAMLALVTTVSTALFAAAEDCMVNGNTYTYTIVSNQAMITDFSGSGEITIPSELGGFPVTKIDDGAFESCRNVTRIVIPDSVTAIGEYAFEWCTSLTSIVIPDSVTTMGKGCFNFCRELQTAGCIGGDYDIQFGWTTRIPAYAFGNASYLTSIAIPDTVTSIGTGAFTSCFDLTEVNLPSQLKEIDNYTFDSCHGLTEIVIPDGVEAIGVSAFFGCIGLEDVVLPKGLTSIGVNAFAECYALTSITVPEKVTSIGMMAFSNCGRSDMNDFSAPSLLCVYFEGNAPADEFSSFPKTATLYYLAGKTGWTDSSAYDADAKTWKGYPLRLYTASDDFIDLTLLAKSTNGGKVTVTLENVGNVTASGTLSLYANNTKGTLLHTESVTVAAGETKAITVTIPDTTIQKVCAKVTTDTEDAFPEDNLDFCIVSHSSDVPYDFNRDGILDIKDSLALFRYSMLPTIYPIPLPW